MPDCTRSRVQRLVDEDQVRVDGRPGRRSLRLKGRERVDVLVPPLRRLALDPENLSIEFLHQDADIAVLVKAAGVVVHPTSHDLDGTLVHGLLFHLTDLSGVSGVERPGIVHRLDKDTSGVLVVAKHDAAHVGLQEQFRHHTIERRYQALVWGRPDPPAGTLRGPIGRHPTDRHRMSSRVRGGRDSTTHYRTLEVLGPFSQLELRLETGRTHQIRVHLADQGYPVLGDDLYGPRPARHLELGEPWCLAACLARRQMLHAFHLGLHQPVRRDWMAWEVDPPEDYRAVLDALRVAAGATRGGSRPPIGPVGEGWPDRSLPRDPAQGAPAAGRPWGDDPEDPG